MPEIHFYHKVRDTLAATCQLVAKAYRSGRRIAILTPDAATAARLDERLWEADPQSFLPHVELGSALAAETPIVLGVATQACRWPTQRDILVNVGAPLPDGFEDFKIVLEVVGPSDAERGPARQRWMEYRARGHQPKAHDMAAGA